LPKLLKHHLDHKAREILDRLADDLKDDTLLDTRQCADWLNVSRQFLELGRMQGYGPPCTVLSPKVVRYRKNAVLRWLIEREKAYAKLPSFRNLTSARSQPALKQAVTSNRFSAS
jgi:hypothetical protein